MLRHRLIFGLLMILVLTGLLALDARWSGADALGAPAWMQSAIGMPRIEGLPVVAVMIVLSILGVVELRHLLTSAGHAPLLVLPTLACALLVFIPFVAANRSIDDVQAMSLWDMKSTVVALAGATILSGFFVMRRQQTAGAAGALASSLSIVLYIGLLGSFLVRLRMFAPVGATWLLLYFLATVKVCDIGAYFTGMAIGKHKMIEWLSPKKTLEGLAGGVAFSVIVAIGVPWAVEHWAAETSNLRGLFPTPLRALLFGIIMALVGQMGDLIESLYKRDANVKDSANAIPAFGGVLDVLDSPLWAAPIAWWILVA